MEVESSSYLLPLLHDESVEEEAPSWIQLPCYSLPSPKQVDWAVASHVQVAL